MRMYVCRYVCNVMYFGSATYVPNYLGMSNVRNAGEKVGMRMRIIAARRFEGDRL